MYDPYEVLGLQEGANRVEVKLVYQRLKELYSSDSLAFYTLLTDSERMDRLEQIESAYRSIVEILCRQPGDDNHTTAGVPEVLESDSFPDPERSTGAFLRWTRERAGLSINQLADRTKISPVKLADIEAERFDRLPATVYLRGFVHEFARSLGLGNASELSEFYLKLNSQAPATES